MSSKTNLFRNLIFESVLGFQFWSLFSGLFPMIWFFPLNELDFTGYEAFLAVLLVPVLCEIKGVLTLIKSSLGLGILRIISLACIGSYQAPTTSIRLVALSVGVAANILVLIAVLSRNCDTQTYNLIWGLLIGFFASLSGRIWYTTVFPTWADVLSNNLILSFCAIANFDRILFNEDEDFTQMRYVPRQTQFRQSESGQFSSHWFTSGISLGNLLYVMIAIYGEVSVVCRWVVRGHPDIGPDPNPWGAVVLIAMFAGVMLSFNYHHLAYSRLWWFLCSVGMYSLYNSPAFTGFAGALLLAIYTFSIAPAVLEETAAQNPARCFLIAMLTFIAEILFSIWTIAYNFVPGGVYTREHTGYILIFIALTWYLCLCLSNDKSQDLPTRSSVENEVMGFSKIITGQWVSMILSLLLILGLSGFAYRYQPSTYEHKVEKDKERVLTVAIWTFHFGFDNEGWPSLEKAATLLNETGADVITLLESDASKPFLGNNDLAMWLGERLHMYSDFGPATRAHTWGNLILSKYPIIYSEHHLLPSPYGELAPGLSATINVSGSLINFVTSHMGNDRDNLDRKLQAEYLASLTAKSVNPVILLAYLTSAPGGRDYQQFISKGRLKDIDDTDHDRWCEYIMYRGLKRLGYGRLSHGGLSDTEIQLGKFEIPTPGNKDWVDNDEIEISASKVPKNQTFDAKFGPFRSGHNWKKTNQFHSSTPKYFLPLNESNQ